MNQSEYPLVTVGLPVFNGAAHLQLTIDAILKQTYSNIEVIICDNASTDETEEIALRSASKDNRVRFLKNEKNIGLFNNFSRVLQEASGEYFMWAAHDDLHSPNFIEECVLLLIKNPHAVLCQTRVAVCLENPETIIYFANLNSYQGKASIEQRYHETLQHFPAVGIYGVYRTKLAKEIPGFRSIPGGDLLWIQELSLRGEFIQSDKLLFQYIARADWNSFESDLNNLGAESVHFKHFILRATSTLFDRIKSILRAQTSMTSKCRLVVIAFRYSIRTILVRGLVKGVGHLHPRILARAIQKKLYWTFLHGPNIEIADKNLFQRRVINPTVGLS